MHMIIPILFAALNFRLDLIVLRLLTVNRYLYSTWLDILIFDNFVFALLWLVLRRTYAITLWEDRYAILMWFTKVRCDPFLVTNCSSSSTKKNPIATVHSAKGYSVSNISFICSLTSGIMWSKQVAKKMPAAKQFKYAIISLRSLLLDLFSSS